MMGELLSRAQPRAKTWSQLQGLMVRQQAAIRNIRQAGGTVTKEDEHTALKLIIPSEQVEKVEEMEWENRLGRGDVAGLMKYLSYKIFNSHVRGVIETKGPNLNQMLGEQDVTSLWGEGYDWSEAASYANAV